MAPPDERGTMPGFYVQVQNALGLLQKVLAAPIQEE